MAKGGGQGFISRMVMGQRKSPEETKNVNINKSKAKELSDYFGLQYQTDEDGNPVLIPHNIANAAASGGGQPETDPYGFSHTWLESAYVASDQKDEAKRKDRYKYYEFMDDNSTESRMTLDTYADEAIVSGMMDENPLSIEISDKGAEKDIMKILKRSGLIADGDEPTNIRGDIRELAKYGDRMYQLAGKNADDIRVIPVREPEKVRVVRANERYGGSLIGFTYEDREEYYPWEFVHFRIPDNGKWPYGASILEGMRGPYQQLVLNEALLAISRASKIERLVIKVPSKGKDPQSAFSNLSQLKSLWKNVIFGSSGNAKSRPRTSSMSDILWLPSEEGYSVDRLSSSIDIASIDDIEYFRDKFLLGSRLPKGHLVTDDSDRLTEGALAAMDLKFARALVPLQYGYTEGMTRLITLLLIILGYDIEKVKVKVSMSKPQAITNQMISSASESVKFIQDMIDSYQRATGQDREGGVSREAWIAIASQLTGLGTDFLSQIGADSPSDPDNDPQNDPEDPDFVPEGVNREAFTKAVNSPMVPENMRRTTCTSEFVLNEYLGVTAQELNRAQHNTAVSKCFTELTEHAKSKSQVSGRQMPIWSERVVRG